MSGLARAMTRALTRDNASSTNALIRNLGGGGGAGVAPVGDLAESLLGWHLLEVWHDGGDKANPAWDLAPIINDGAHTANEINSMFWANEGSALITSNPNQDSSFGFTCSTPYDISTAVWDGTRVSTATAVITQGAEWAHDGSSYLTNQTWAKRLDMYTAATAYKVDSTDVRGSTCTNAELGFDDSIVGNACMSPDGTAVYAIGEMQTNIISMLKRTLDTPYDLSDRGTLVTQEIESQGVVSISAATGHLSIDASETLMWYVSGGTLASIVMSTPGDITTAIWVWTPVTDKFNPLMDGGNMTSGQFDHTGTKFYAANTGAIAADSEVRVFSRAGADRGATGTLTGTILNAMTKTGTLTDGGTGILDLNPLVSGLTTKILDSMEWSVDGKYLITMDPTNQTTQIFECSTPYDLSTAVVQGTPDTFLGAGATCVGMDYWGEYLHYLKGSTDTLNVYSIGTTHATRYTTAAGNGLWASVVDTELGHSTADDGCMTFSEDGYSLYGMIEKTGDSKVYLAKGEIDPDMQRYDVDEITTVTDIDIDSDFSTLDVADSDMRVVAGETYVLYLTGEILYLGTMSTPGDISTLTWDKTNTLDVSGDGDMVGFAYNQELTKFWFLSNTSGTPVITVYESPQAQALAMDTVNGSSTPTISNGGQTLTCVDAAAFQWGTMSTDVYDRDYTLGGKFIIEVEVDTTIQSVHFYCPGLWDPDQNVSSSYGGNHDGIGYLGSTALTRIYHGDVDLDYTSGSPHIAMTSGAIITMAINLDDDEVTVYIDGVTTGTVGIVRSTPDSNFLRPVIKGYRDAVFTITPEILYPVYGYEPWA